jgi:hypothetical protein
MSHVISTDGLALSVLKSAQSQGFPNRSTGVEFWKFYGSGWKYLAKTWGVRVQNTQGEKLYPLMT